MGLHEFSKTEKSADYKDFQKIKSDCETLDDRLLAPGVGFEPTRPFRATDLQLP